MEEKDTQYGPVHCHNLGDITRDLLEKGMIDFESLTPVPAQLVYWFAWTGFYPESNLY